MTGNQSTARPDYQTRSISIGVEPWKCGEFVVTVCGAPVGVSLPTRAEAERIAEWLRTAIWGVRTESQVAVDAYLERPALERPWGVFAKGNRIGTVHAVDAIAALGRARRQFTDAEGVVVSPDPEAPEEG